MATRPADPAALARDAQRATFALARGLEGDVQIDPPQILQLLLGAAVGLRKAIAEIADAAEAAGENAAAEALHDAMAHQVDVIRSLDAAGVALVKGEAART